MKNRIYQKPYAITGDVDIIFNTKVKGKTRCELNIPQPGFQRWEYLNQLLSSFTE